jgi:DNA-binding MarR family transcriptional regulator
LVVGNKFLAKERSEKDKRRVMITSLKKCHEFLEKAPAPLQETFTGRFSNLEHWEQLILLSYRIANMMLAEKIAA